jgi:uncharacterized membrane protein YvbJ
MVLRDHSGSGGVLLVATMKCPQCNEKVARRVKCCPNCGFNVRKYLPTKEDAEGTREQRLANIVGKVFAAIIIIIIMIILLIKLGVYDWTHG